MKFRTPLLTFLLSLSIVAIVHAQQKAETPKLTLEAFEKKLYQSPHPQILDVRSADEFSENHLTGAINLVDVERLSFGKKGEAFNKNEPVFVYSINNGRSGTVANQLRTQGFNEVYELPGGIAHWIGAGKPIESNAGKGISIEEFRKAIAARNLVLVDVGAKHCGGCKKLAPIVDEIGNEQADKLKIMKIELYDNRELVSTLGIEAVPTLILYKEGKPVWKKSGTMSKAEIQESLSQASSGSSCEGADELMKKRKSHALNK